MASSLGALMRPVHIALEQPQAGEKLSTAVYTRVSTVDQARGYGKAAQTHNVMRFVERESSIRVVDSEYCDDGVSGKKVSREGIDKLLADAAAGKIDLVIADKLDRLGRSNIAIYRVVERLKELGVPLICVANNIDTRQSGASQTLPFIAAMAEVEHTLILERTQGGKQAKAKENGWVGGEPPYGYAIDGKGKRGSKLVICEEEAAILRLAVAMHLDERLSFAEIARRLNARGLKPRHAKAWTTANLRNRLASASLIYHVAVFRKTPELGLGSKTQLNRNGQPLHGETVLIQLPAILDDERAARLERAIGKPGERRQRSSAKYPLSKRMFGLCGAPYAGNYSSSRKTRLYRCQGMNNKGGCGDPYLEADEVEKAIADKVAKFVGDPQKLNAVVEAWLAKLPETRMDFEQRVQRHGKAVAGLRQELVTMMTTFKGLVDEKLVKAAAAEKQRELEEAEKQLSYAQAWLAEYEQREQFSRDAVRLARHAVEKMGRLTIDELADLAALLNLKVRIAKADYVPRSGQPCKTVTWHVENQISVPDDLSDSQWDEVRQLLIDYNGPQHMRRGTDYRTQMNALFHRLRTGTQWDEMPVHFGNPQALRNRQLLWLKNGTWEAVVKHLLASQEGAPVSGRKLPSMTIAGGFDYERIRSNGLAFAKMSNLREESLDCGELCFQLEV